MSRLQTRTRLLHDAIHYPSENSASRHRVETDRVITNLLTRIEALETELKDAQARLAKVETLQEVCDDLSEALGQAEKSTRRGERKAEATKNAMSVRIEVLEARLALLEQRHQQRAHTPRFLVTLYEGLHKHIMEWSRKLLRIPQTIWRLGIISPSSTERILVSHPKVARSLNSELTPLKVNDNKPSMRSPDRERVSQHAPRLATIPEAGDSDLDSDGTYVSEKEVHSSSPPQFRTLRVRNRGDTDGRSRDRRTKRTYGENLLECVECLVLWPYRAGVKVLAFLFPSAQHLMF